MVFRLYSDHSLQVEVSYQTARRVKHQLLKRSREDRATQYQQLPDYISRLRATNPTCGHAVSLILRLRKQPRDYIPKVSTLETYRWTYMRDMHPVDIQYLQILREDECYPPLFRSTRGRPKERRIRKGERKARGLQRGVQMAGALGDVPDNAPQRCTQCGNVGHNRTNCNEVYQLPIVYPVE